MLLIIFSCEPQQLTISPSKHGPLLKNYSIRVRENKDTITFLNKVSWLDGKVFIIVKAFEINIALYIKYTFYKAFMSV